MRKLYTILSAVIITSSVFAQSPEKMSYQAVVRDASNALVSNSTVGMQISILQGSPSGTAVYVETQTPVSNANGLVSLEIGGGTIVSGTFSAIDWSAGPYFVKTDTDPTGGTTYTITGTSQLLSVPYALYAKSSGSFTDNTTYSVGDYAQGGVVFYVTPNGKHGLVIATQDQSSSFYDFRGGELVMSNPSLHSATGKEFTDWRLPTKYEITVINTNKAIIDSVSIANGGVAISNTYYWTSSIGFYGSSNTIGAYTYNFSSSSGFYGPMSNIGNVRSVRSF